MPSPTRAPAGNSSVTRASTGSSRASQATPAASPTVTKSPATITSVMVVSSNSAATRASSGGSGSPRRYHTPIAGSPPVTNRTLRGCGVGSGTTGPAKTRSNTEAGRGSAAPVTHIR